MWVNSQIGKTTKESTILRLGLVLWHSKVKKMSTKLKGKATALLPLNHIDHPVALVLELLLGGRGAISYSGKIKRELPNVKVSKTGSWAQKVIQ